ncbi:type VI secretion system tip protein TssI/VgrG, partial [Motilimonas sp. 1_MG-2023]|uniref:type VI secretion system tip protein TssI/VgrG n=1 Tax=Motilimonas sp. 1_MG-2023 TaxID=3062672 RepID=UPI0026E115A0
MADKTGLQFTFTAQTLDPETFEITEFSGKESLSDPFSFVCQLASRNSDLSANDVVDKTATLTVWQDGERQRDIHGIVSQFSVGDTGHHHTRYTLTLTASMARLALRQNSRIFQQLNVAEIISIILQEMGITDYAFAQKYTPTTREFCVQYRETDLAFVQRLAAEEGLFYYFEHGKDKHTVIFADNSQSMFTYTQPVPYNANAGGYFKGPFISGFRLQSQIRPHNVQLKDYSFKKPAYRFLQNQHATGLDFQR